MSLMNIFDFFPVPDFLRFSLTAPKLRLFLWFSFPVSAPSSFSVPVSVFSVVLSRLSAFFFPLYEGPRAFPRSLSPAFRFPRFFEVFPGPRQSGLAPLRPHPPSQPYGIGFKCTFFCPFLFMLLHLPRLSLLEPRGPKLSCFLLDRWGFPQGAEAAFCRLLVSIQGSF